MLEQLAGIKENLRDLPVLSTTDSSSIHTSSPLFSSADSDSFRERDKDRIIPRHLWMASCEIPSHLPSTIQSMIDRNKLWTFHVVSCPEQDAFMDAEFAHTKVREAYYLINPIFRAARCDIWRQAVLYTHGG
jgi:mannosyltransferase OCH1-like enzyme